MKTIILLSPLEQFENFIVIKIKLICSWLERTFSILIPYVEIHLMGTTFLLSGMIICMFLLFYTNIIYLRQLLTGPNILILVEKYFILIEQIIRDLISDLRGKRIYYAMFICLFVLINFCNVLGLIPYTFAFTTQFFFTFSLSVIFFCMINFTGILYHGTNLLVLFFPEGTPIFILPLLLLIEFISYYARVFSLAIRLFANMTAGHILLKILSWFIYLLTDIFMFGALAGMLLVTVLWGLEFFISILQAYVFLILCGIYLNDVLQLH